MAKENSEPVKFEEVKIGEKYWVMDGNEPCDFRAIGKCEFKDDELVSFIVLYTHGREDGDQMKCISKRIHDLFRGFLPWRTYENMECYDAEDIFVSKEALINNLKDR